MLRGAGFLGTGATLGADLTLIVQILFFFALSIGVIAQLLRKYKVHDLIQTPIVLLNFVFIILIMVASFAEQRVARTLPERPVDLYYVTPFIHACLGITSQGLATYALLAGHRILPRKIGRLRYFMWATYGFWMVTVFFGLSTYLVWYILNPSRPVAVTEIDFTEIADETGQPAVQRALLQNFAFQPTDLTVVAGTTVVWVNQDAAPHNVTFVDGSVESDNFFQGEAFEVAFDEPGVFPIYCTLHANPTSGMIGTVTVIEATEENIAQVAAQPAVEQAIVPPTPTPPPPVPLAPVTLIEPPSPEDTVAGLMAFRDNVAPSDSVTLAMSGIDPAPAGSELHVWLLGAGGTALDLGLVAPNDQGGLSFTHTDPARQNLMTLYDGVQLSLEPVNDPDPRPGQIVFSGRQAASAYELIRQITAAAAETPRGLGYGIGARLQAEELIRHAQFIQLAFDLGSIADAQRHAEHIINILEGEEGEFFDDWDGAHGTQNPGDGFGLIPYIRLMKATAEEASLVTDATNAIQVHAGHVDIITDNALETARAIRQAALEIVEANSIGVVGPQVQTISRLALRLLAGEDVNGDGDLSLAEGGAFLAYQHAQYMAAVGIIAGDAAGVAEPLAIGGGETQLAGGEIVIDMLDFEYSLSTVTIPAGTQVRFVNRGLSRHSAAADDGTFNTDLLDPGQEQVITFDEPGFFPYYCVLHGTRGGVGMAASITVVEAGSTGPAAPTLEPPVEPTEALPQPLVTPTEAPPAPTRAPAPPAAPRQFRIDMLDFTYSDLNLEIPAGSTVTWFNAGQFEHSATADDGSWDTTLLDAGQEASITFDTPGSFPYYCTLHGTPGGVGMAATITVTE